MQHPGQPSGSHDERGVGPFPCTGCAVEPHHFPGCTQPGSQVGHDSPEHRLEFDGSLWCHVQLSRWSGCCSRGTYGCSSQSSVPSLVACRFFQPRGHLPFAGATRTHAPAHGLPHAPSPGPRGPHDARSTLLPPLPETLHHRSRGPDRAAPNTRTWGLSPVRTTGFLGPDEGSVPKIHAP